MGAVGEHYEFVNVTTGETREYEVRIAGGDGLPTTLDRIGPIPGVAQVFPDSLRRAPIRGRSHWRKVKA